jgi:UDP-MurNAc hydroxylase
LMGRLSVGPRHAGGIMKIRLVSHASVIASCSDAKIWTDPWLISKAFNDSWALWPAPEFSDSLLKKVQYLWLSHEHPDHLNFPTLSSLAPDFKERVTVLFQDNNPERIFTPLRKLGFRNFQILKHRRIITLAPQTCVHCYRVGTLDSCLGIKSEGHTVLNVNDARLNPTDYRRIFSDLGRIDVVLNQFSVAVKDWVVDYERHGRAAARNVLESVSADHAGLNAKLTIPFASFMYFSSIDNKDMNAFANKPRDIFEFCKSRGQEVMLLYPGDEYNLNQAPDSSRALARYEENSSKLKSLAYDVPPVVAFPQLSNAFHTLVQNLRARYPQFLLRRLRPLRVRIPDLDITVEIAIANGSMTEAETDPQHDAIIYSQPLYYCLAQSWGMGTLTISGRFILLKNQRNWQVHKALFALNNAEVYLRLRYLLRRQNWAYLKDRLNGMRRYKARTRSHVRKAQDQSLRKVA